MFSRDPLQHPEPLIERVYSYASYRVGAGADAEDITSATFERAVRYRDSYDPSKGTPLAWVLGIARRCVDEAFAARQPTDAVVREIQAPGDLEAETAERLELEAALRRLDSDTMELLSLRYGADLSAKRIAEVLNSTPGAVRVALHRAHSKLRKALESERMEHVPDRALEAEAAQ